MFTGTKEGQTSFPRPRDFVQISHNNLSLKSPLYSFTKKEQ